MKYWKMETFTDDMGSFVSLVNNRTEPKHKDALWQVNSARAHDGLAPLQRMPKGTKYTPVTQRGTEFV